MCCSMTSTVVKKNDESELVWASSSWKQRDVTAVKNRNTNRKASSLSSENACPCERTHVYGHARGHALAHVLRTVGKLSLGRIF